MPCGSPCGLYIGLSQAELLELRAAAVAAGPSGQWTSITGGQKTGSLQYPFTPQQMLIEVNYALRQMGVMPARITKTYSDFLNPPCPNNVANEQV